MLNNTDSISGKGKTFYLFTSSVNNSINFKKTYLKYNTKAIIFYIYRFFQILKEILQNEQDSKSLLKLFGPLFMLCYFEIEFKLRVVNFIQKPRIYTDAVCFDECNTCVNNVKKIQSIFFYI